MQEDLRGTPASRLYLQPTRGWDVLKHHWINTNLNWLPAFFVPPLLSSPLLSSFPSSSGWCKVVISTNKNIQTRCSMSARFYFQFNLFIYAVYWVLVPGSWFLFLFPAHLHSCSGRWFLARQEEQLDLSYIYGRGLPHLYLELGYNLQADYSSPVSLSPTTGELETAWWQSE